MTIARFYYAGAQCMGCAVQGHSGYAEAGSDIVCAAVTTAVQTVANLLTEIYRLPVTAEEDEETATVTIRLTEPEDSGNAQKLLEGLWLELQLLADAYPAHIQLIHMEV
ncbi:MAG: ribosomal-processing cysteine protease Prp [Ruminococcus sp.]